MPHLSVHPLDRRSASPSRLTSTGPPATQRRKTDAITAHADLADAKRRVLSLSAALSHPAATDSTPQNRARERASGSTQKPANSGSPLT